MGLLASHQPWNLIIFMAVPVILAETIAVCELYLLLTRDRDSIAARLSRLAGFIVGPYMIGVFIYLVMNAVIPVTTAGEWKGVGDVVAVFGYLLSALPLIAISALEYRILGRRETEEYRVRLHAIFVAVFLVLAHVAMIFGMLDPTVLGWVAPTTTMVM